MSDNTDLESLPKGGGKEISQFSWKGLTVTVKDSKTQEPLDILKDVEGCARPGIHSFFLIFSSRPYIYPITQLWIHVLITRFGTNRRHDSPHGP